MQSTAERIEWLERQLVEVGSFIERDKAALALDPDDFALQVGLRSWEATYAEHARDLDLLRNAKVRR